MPPLNKENKRKEKKSDSSLEDEEYRKRRDRNNLAVKRSRDKTKRKTKETLDRVMQLKSENETLEEKIKLLSKELSFLKDLFLAYAGRSSENDFSNINLPALINENDETSSNAIKDLLSDPNFKLIREQ